MVVVVVLAAGMAAAAVRSTDGTGSKAASPKSTAPSTNGRSTSGPAGTPGTTVARGPEPSYVSTIKEQVAGLRGLRWKAPLAVDVVSRAELVRRLKAANARDAHPDRLAGDGDTL